MDDNGNIAAQRLRAAGRIPVNVWGDVLTNGAPPEVRRVLIGQEAHESLLVYFYLGEILALSEMVRAIQGGESAGGGLLAGLELIRKASDDSLSQIQPEILQIFGPIAILIDALGTDDTEFCELGCSFFSALDKLRVCAHLLGIKSDIT